MTIETMYGSPLIAALGRRAHAPFPERTSWTREGVPSASNLIMSHGTGAPATTTGATAWCVSSTCPRFLACQRVSDRCTETRSARARAACTLARRPLTSRTITSLIIRSRRVVDPALRKNALARPRAPDPRGLAPPPPSRSHHGGRDRPHRHPPSRGPPARRHGQDQPPGCSHHRPRVRALPMGLVLHWGVIRANTGQEGTSSRPSSTPRVPPCTRTRRCSLLPSLRGPAARPRPRCRRRRVLLTSSSTGEWYNDNGRNFRIEPARAGAPQAPP